MPATAKSSSDAAPSQEADPLTAPDQVMVQAALLPEPPPTELHPHEPAAANNSNIRIMTTLLSRKRSLFGLPTGVQAVVEGRCDERGGAHKKGVPAAERWPKLTWPSQRCFEELLTSPRFLESLLSGAERTTDQQRTLQALVAENGNAVYDALGGAFRTLRAG
ncbi:MAG: hypothetical protein ACKVPX_05415, partial [Myxococcaceae bacterium]